MKSEPNPALWRKPASQQYSWKRRVLSP